MTVEIAPISVAPIMSIYRDRDVSPLRSRRTQPVRIFAFYLPAMGPIQGKRVGSLRREP
jgi:hypothetical protein